MAFAYFKPDGTIMTVASKQARYDDPTIIEIAVPDLTHPNDIYLDLETTTVKERMTFRLEVSYNKIRGVPVGTLATMADGPFTITDGEIEFEADVPETVLLYLDHPHYIAQYVRVETGPEAK